MGTKIFNLGVDVTTLTPHQLISQALVLMVDGGIAADRLDYLEDEYLKELAIDEDDLEDAITVSEDDMAMPEGMNLRQMSRGVIPRDA